ncbi:MAG TPA: nuclear transport factor 2 family protein [Parapedobacter sp.]|uniref:nuclear transport factor 2 family protein n=1 Tax=Parapedobacter sp. TaxID=1958893 RepID=UPI002BD907C5|nr:nuclear transport factor 2 family protein [Parapedobacter sp.]HWK56521.1 nuclear transport factor 2 family protein [Parapedobacter sp.]
MATLLGAYLNKLGVRKEKVRGLANIKSARMNDLNNKDTAKPLPEEFYKIIFIAIKLSDLEDKEFVNAINFIYPDRPKNNLLGGFQHLPRDVRFLKKHMLKQSEVEQNIGMAENKISRLVNEKAKDLLAVELICFIEGLGLDVLETFRKLYGPIGEDESASLPGPEILNERTKIVYLYIKAYNELDAPNMVVHMADTIVFDHYENNQSTLHLEGIDEFKKQAAEALAYFTERRQTILSLTHKPNATEITVAYEAIAGMDFPNGIKEGDTIQISGRSVFEFSPDGKISKLTDYS